METFLRTLGEALLSQGAFAIIASAEGAAVIYLFKLLVKSYDDRIAERVKSEETAHRAMAQRAEELERLTRILEGTRKR